VQNLKNWWIWLHTQ